jgi:hypothetical protein
MAAKSNPTGVQEFILFDVKDHMPHHSNINVLDC